MGNLTDLFTQPFMQHALLVGSIASLLAGLIGVFIVLQGNSFAAHSLAQMGFAGAAGAVLVGIDPLWGLVLFALAGAGGLGALHVTERGRDVSTALFLAAALGLGALFLTLNNNYATAAFSLLFGSIVGVSGDQVWQTALLALLCLLLLALIYRPLLLSTLNPELARARGVPVRLVQMLFLVLIAVAAAVTVPTVGALLIFSLMVGPAGAAVHLVHRPGHVLLLSVCFALVATWGSMIIAYQTDWPVGFLIASVVTVIYLGARVWSTARA